MMLLQEIPKNRQRVIRISIDEFAGKRFVNIREWAQRPNAEHAPTHRGTTLNATTLPAAIDALTRAQQLLEE